MPTIRTTCQYTVLTAMKSNPDFTLFTNAYSCVWYTVPVLEHALTESNFYNNKPFNESISIIDMAKKAGYKTYWFSNQAPSASPIHRLRWLPTRPTSPNGSTGT